MRACGKRAYSVLEPHAQHRPHQVISGDSSWVGTVTGEPALGSSGGAGLVCHLSPPRLDSRDSEAST